jgi:hypothetical protein
MSETTTTTTTTTTTPVSSDLATIRPKKKLVKTSFCLTLLPEDVLVLIFEFISTDQRLILSASPIFKFIPSGVIWDDSNWNNTTVYLRLLMKEPSIHITSELRLMDTQYDSRIHSLNQIWWNIDIKHDNEQRTQILSMNNRLNYAWNYHNMFTKVQKLNIYYDYLDEMGKIYEQYNNQHWFYQVHKGGETFKTTNSVSFLYKFQHITDLTYSGISELSFVISHFQSVQKLFLHEPKQISSTYASFLPLINELSFQLWNDFRDFSTVDDNGGGGGDGSSQTWLKPLSKHRIKKITISFSSLSAIVSNEVTSYTASVFESSLRSLTLIGFTGFKQTFDWKNFNSIVHIDIEDLIKPRLKFFGTSWTSDSIEYMISGLSTMKYVQTIRIVTREIFEPTNIDTLIDCDNLRSLQIPNWKIVYPVSIISKIQNRGGTVIYKA